jgi:hypothetical protein
LFRELIAAALQFRAARDLDASVAAEQRLAATARSAGSPAAALVQAAESTVA